MMEEGREARALSTGAGYPGPEVEALFVRYAADVRTYLRCLLGNDDDAADLTQDVFALALRALRREPGAVSHTRTWLFRIARNRAIDHWRRERLKRIFISSERAEDTVDQDPTDIVVIWQAVERLRPLRREAVVLKYRWRLNSDEIASLQRRSPAAVRMDLSRALHELQINLRDIARNQHG